MANPMGINQYTKGGYASKVKASRAKLRTTVKVTDLRGRTVGIMPKTKAFKEYGSVQYGYSKVGMKYRKK